MLCCQHMVGLKVWRIGLFDQNVLHNLELQVGAVAHIQGVGRGADHRIAADHIEVCALL